MNILVADNSKVVRTIIREELESIGLTVYEADGEAEIYRTLSMIPIDLITLAVQLHEGNGFDICQTVNSEEFIHSPRNYSDQRFPIIFITSNDNLEDRKLGFESGATDFISKPFHKGEVAALVKNLLFPETRLKGATAIVVDDSKQSRMIVTDFLSSHGVIVFEAADGSEGYELIKEYRSSIDLIITDFEMPGLTGDELCFRIRKELNLKDVPILVLSGAGNRISVLDLFRSGATDYLHKPFIKEELLGRIYVHLESRLLQKKMIQKVNDMEKITARMRQLSTVDSLTRIHNRKFFFDRFREAVSRKDRYEQSLGLLLVDIDDFRSINERVGHKLGDMVLVEIAKVLRTSVRKVDIVARIGGGEFAILVSHINKQGVHTLGAKVGKRIVTRKFLASANIDPGKVTVSIGALISFTGDGLDADKMFAETMRSLHHAKKNGRNRIYCRDAIQKTVKAI